MADLSNELDLNVPAAPSLTLDAAPAAPTLTLDPAADERVIAESKKATPVQVEDTPLSPEEQKMVNDFAEKIDITNSQMVLQYGAASQKKLSDFSETALSRVKTKDMGETGELITNLISELQGFDATTEQPKGIFGFFKKTSNSIEQLKTRYDSADKNVERIKAQLEDHQVTLMKDITMLDKMYELNLVYFKELTMYILAGKKKLAEVRANDLKAAQEKAQRTQLPEDAQAARDLADQCERFEKKLYDLELTRNIVAEKKITCLMVTHNMHQALELGNRTLMMDSGRIVFDVKGEERSRMTVDDLLEKFRENAGKNLDNDRILLSKVEK